MTTNAEYWVVKNGVESRRSRVDRSNPTTPDNWGADPLLWTLDMAEDFTSPPSGTGLSAVDNTRWNVQDGTTASNQDARYLAANTTVANSKLKLTGKLESSGGLPYTAGYITTDEISGHAQKFQAQPYFRAMVRAKLTYQKGMWCAPLWFRPSDNYGAAEIDLGENYGAERDAQGNKQIHYTLHTGANYTSPAQGGDHAQAAYTRDFTVDPEGWHTWIVEKIPNQITMWCDGVVAKNFIKSAETAITSRWDTAFEAGRTWDLRSQLQIGGDWPTTAAATPDGTTVWANSFLEVDYIVVWRQAA